MKLLVIRLSAMGDVALSVPVIKAVCRKYKKAEIILMTNKAYNVFFKDVENIQFVNPDLKGKHKGIKGLFALYREVKKVFSPDIIIDIHNVLRSKLLVFFFSLSGKRCFVLHKGRKEKKRLTRKKHKIRKALTHTTMRYAATFGKAGFPIQLTYSPTYTSTIKSKLVAELIKDKPKKIGIALFAKHESKQYPLERSEILIQKLTEADFYVFLFGGGKKEQDIAEKISAKFPNTLSLIGKFSFKEEIELMDNLDIMISPDSGNMHIAALTSTKIISIWGATHPFAGFTPFVAPERHHIIQNEKLTCRPCSVFGNKACYKKTLECMHSISPEEIFAACKKLID